MLFWEMRTAGLALNDRKADRVATHLLEKLSTGVDNYRAHLRRLRLPKERDKVYQDYLTTIQGDTDSAATRERRRQILRSLLWSLYREKDGKRLFSREQRRILWHSDAEKNCAICGKRVTWDEVAIDHIIAHSRGGRTAMNNAALTHIACNSKKGARASDRRRP
jgi:5-methylcytosine-specific restriction endonuclease McrA